MNVMYKSLECFLSDDRKKIHIILEKVFPSDFVGILLKKILDS